MKILLIEDSKFQRIANERALLRARYSVIHAGDGDEGLRSARENNPDLILLDMMLPKLSGLDVLRALKGDIRLKHIPIMVLSGLGQGNEAKLLEEGAAAFLVKSEKSLENNSAILIQAIEGILRGTETEREPPIHPVHRLGN
jgi:CheY-like chemotaxis protein